MPKAGRPRSEWVHRHFTEIPITEHNFSTAQSRCNYCHKSQARLADRMKGHLESCGPFQEQQLPHEQSQPLITNTVHRTMTPQKQYQLDVICARGLIKDGHPLDFYEHPGMRDSFQALNPAYTPPDRHKIETQLVDVIFEDIKAKVLEIASKEPQLLHKQAFASSFLSALDRYAEITIKNSAYDPALSA